MQPKAPKFALDHNFPQEILDDVLRLWTPELDLEFIYRIDPRLVAGMEDHMLILALSQAGFEGLITNDDSMLFLPEVVSMIEQTRFSVVACVDTGHDPLRATGMLLTQIPFVAKRHVRNKPQVWRLNVTERQPGKFADHKRDVERRTKQSVDAYRLTAAQLRQAVLPASE